MRKPGSKGAPTAKAFAKSAKTAKKKPAKKKSRGTPNELRRSQVTLQRPSNRSDITSALTTRFIDQGISRIQRQLRTMNEIKVRNYTVTSQTEHLSPCLMTSSSSSRCTRMTEELRASPCQTSGLMLPTPYTGKPQSIHPPTSGPTPPPAAHKRDTDALLLWRVRRHDG